VKILVIGSGGREHALCWRLQQDGHEILALPGSLGMAEVAECVAGSPEDLDGICRVATESQVDLVVVGPEVPLVAGLADKLRSSGVSVFGPGAKGAQLEGSKVFSKQFFQQYGIRSARFFECETMDAVRVAVAELGERMVVKVDGLAAGKGVVVCDSAAEALEAARTMLEGRFGDAGKAVIVEDRLEGREVSVMAICDGQRYEILAQAEDHKAIFDGDKGPNTGGMGTVSPVSWVDDALIEAARKDIFDPTLVGLQAEGIDFRGVLYAGLMVDRDNKPWLLEYNVRFGDPETQPVLARMKSDLGEWLAGAAKGELPSGTIEWDPRVAVCVVLASKGYPASSSKGDPISGIEDAVALGEVTVFRAGTRLEGSEEVTNGGRVLGVTALGPDPASAREKAYTAVSKIQFSGMQFRRDIGARGE
jgi:phosphoribosylamine--glycine ligase